MTALFEQYYETLSNNNNHDNLMLLFISFLHSKHINNKKKKELHSRYAKRFFRQLSLYERQRRRRKIPRCCLQLPSQSAWRTLYESVDDQGLITLTGFDHMSFHWLLQRFAPLYENTSPYISNDGTIQRKENPKKGRPRLLKPEDCLGLALAWTRTRGSQIALQMIFGITGTPLDVYIKYSRRILIHILKRDDLAKVALPDDNSVREFQAAIQRKHPHLDGVWSTMDGLKLYLEVASDEDKQNMFYNGWKCDHYVVSVFVFAPDGTIPICTLNVPGSQHDSIVAEWGRIYEKLEKVYNSVGGKCVVDSAFSQLRNDYLVKSGQTGLRGETREEIRRNIMIEKEATAVRQTAEWGMRAMQSSFPRIKDRLSYEERGERRLILTLCVLLFNVRARLVGINQIRNTYMPHLNADANERFVLPLVPTIMQNR